MGKRHVTIAALCMFFFPNSFVYGQSPEEDCAQNFPCKDPRLLDSELDLIEKRMDDERCKEKIKEAESDGESNAIC